MAKFTPGPAVAEVRGSVGGTTFSRNRFGAYMRQRVKPTVPTSDAFLAATARLSAGSIAWQALTDDQRTAWATWAQTNPVTGSLGFSQILTGHTAFTGIAIRRDLIGEDPLDAPPIGPAPDPLSSMSLSADIGVGAFDITFTPSPLDGALSVYVKACVVASPGINYVKNRLRLLLIAAAATTSTLDIETEMVARFGELFVNQNVTVECSVFHRGTALLSAPLRADAVIVST